MDYLKVRNARKTTFVVRQAVREEHSRPLNLRRLWPCPSVWTTCRTIFKSSANWFAATLDPQVFLENFLRERASEPTLLADNELRSDEEREGFFSLSSPLLDSLSPLGGSLSLSRRKISRKISETRVVCRHFTRWSVHFRESLRPPLIFISWMGWYATYQF